MFLHVASTMNRPASPVVVVAADARSVLDALQVWRIKPHVANRNLAGSVLLNEAVWHPADGIDVKAAIAGCIADAGEEAPDLECLDMCCAITAEISSRQDVVRVEISTRKLLPKCTQKFAKTTELVVLLNGTNGVCAWFVPIKAVTEEDAITCNKHLSEWSYKIEFNMQDHTLNLFLHTQFGMSPPVVMEALRRPLVATEIWLRSVLLHKLRAWSEASAHSADGCGLRKDQSLALVDVEEYSNLYAELKGKYAARFIESWSESTDPVKFVHEDIGIATYLLLLWRRERIELQLSKPQTFVDLGCGNGLLVYLLTAEGHTGRGIDLASRDIWRTYDAATRLEESALLPNDLRVEEDWIIGNHSDELTPWIPVIASRSTNDTRYFVLPCCFHDFDTKFQRQGGGSSHYEAYLDFIRSIGETCGFTIEQDALRIPSTKKICQVARQRSEHLSDEELDLRLNRLLRSRGSKLRVGHPQHEGEEEDEDVACFVPRATDNTPRNCSRVDDDVKRLIVDAVTSKLLETNVLRSSPSYDGKRTTSDIDWNAWNAGANVPFTEIVPLFNTEILASLKCQCGGLQTLLRNNQHIFKVVQGHVSLRDYRIDSCTAPSIKRVSAARDEKREASRKTKLCWFHSLHPQGCPLTWEQCSFAHGESDRNYTNNIDRPP